MSLLDETREPGAGQGSSAASQGNENEINPLLLVFMDNPLARRLVVAWESCGGNEDDWHAFAGVTRSDMEDAHRVCYALRKNRICLDGGRVSPIVLTYIRGIVAAPLRKNAPTQPKGGGRRGRR